jgi:hypothetical protein
LDQTDTYEIPGAHIESQVVGLAAAVGGFRRLGRCAFNNLEAANEVPTVYSESARPVGRAGCWSASH